MTRCAGVAANYCFVGAMRKQNVAARVLAFEPKIAYESMAAALTGLESRYPTIASNHRFNSGHKSCRNSEYRR